MSFIQFQLRRDTAADWTAADPVLADGEMGLELDTKQYKIGDGVTAWSLLPYWSGGGGIPDAPNDGEDYVRKNESWAIADYFSGSYTDLTNVPTFATVAFTGDYNDLINTPAIPAVPTELDDLTDVVPYGAAQAGFALAVNTTGSETVWLPIVSFEANNILTDDTNGSVFWDGDYADLINEPQLAPVATTGDYNDLINTPVIPAGVPAGGTTGQALVKQSNADFDIEWATVGGGGGGYWEEFDSENSPVKMRNIQTIEQVCIGDIPDTSTLGQMKLFVQTEATGTAEPARFGSPSGLLRLMMCANDAPTPLWENSAVFETSSGTDFDLVLSTYLTGDIKFATGGREVRMTIDPAGDVNIAGLAGAETQMVVADAAGTLGTQAIPSGGTVWWEEFEAGPNPGDRLAIRNIPTATGNSVCIGNQPTQNIGGDPKLYLRTEQTGNRAELFRMQSDIGYVRCMMPDDTATVPQWENSCVFETAQGNNLDFVFSTYLTGRVMFLTGPRLTAMEIDATQGITFPILAGADTRMVVADANGKLGVQAIPGGGGDSFWAGNGSDIQNTNAGNVNVQGQLTATGNVIAAFSDERLKQDAQTLCNALDKVNAIDAFTYRPNALAVELGAADSQDERQVGVSAQDVERVLPEVVKPAPFNADYKTVQYERMVPLLLAAIQELTARVEELEER